MKIEANGITIAYYLDGPTEREGDSPVVVLSHSLAASSAMWEPQVRALAGGHRVLRYDIRGHGESDVPPGPYSLTDLGVDVLGLLGALGVGPVYFVGLSLGGIVGQWLALTHPQALRGVVLCSTNAKMTPDAPAVWDERIAVAQNEGMEAHVEPTIGRWFTPGFVEHHPEVVDPVREGIRKTDPEGYIACIEAMRPTNFLERLSGVRMPALVIAGDEDPGLPASRAIHERIAGSEMIVLSPAAHLCNLERPDDFNRALLEFLARKAVEGA